MEMTSCIFRNVGVALWVAFPTSDHTGDRIQLMIVGHFIAQSLFIITLSLYWYDLNNVERDVKYQTIIIFAAFSLINIIFLNIYTPVLIVFQNDLPMNEMYI